MTGISVEHASVFQRVANATNCVIASRAVGKYATGLIRESYATKGFHNKAKSCDWGPMAGFVLSDPRFTKSPDDVKQQQELDAATALGGMEVKLYISDERVRWLMREDLFRPERMRPGEYIGFGSKQGLCLLFKLTRETVQVHGAVDRPLWAVSYQPVGEVGAMPASGDNGVPWTPVMAMRDPHCKVPPSDYRSATTGDYDLFAVWASKGAYAPGGLDKRMVSHQELEKNIKLNVKDTGEDPHLGNMTGRILAIRKELNREFKREGYTGGDLIHHSDEGGRPFVGDIDLPVFAAVPLLGAYGIYSVQDLREFCAILADAYVPVFNPGWMKALVGGDVKAGLAARSAAAPN